MRAPRVLDRTLQPVHGRIERIATARGVSYAEIRTDDGSLIITPLDTVHTVSPTPLARCGACGHWRVTDAPCITCSAYAHASADTRVV